MTIPDGPISRRRGATYRTPISAWGAVSKVPFGDTHIALAVEAVGASEYGTSRCGDLLSDRLDSPSVVRAGDTMIDAAMTASHAGRALFAAVRTLPVPVEPAARLWFGANLLREHCGDGHVAALVTLGVSGTESHVLHTLADGVPAEKFGRLRHLPKERLDGVIGAMRERGLVGDDGRLTAGGSELKKRLEELSDEAATAAYRSLVPEQLDQLITDLTPLAAAIPTQA